MDYELDIATWRSGGDYNIELAGEGETALCNEGGFMCCLGQFAQQAGYEQGDLQSSGDPEDLFAYMDLGDEIVEKYKPFITAKKDTDGCYEYHNTNLSCHLMDANDSSVGIRARIDRIRDLLEAEGHTLSIVNAHVIDEIEEAARDE